MAQCDICVSDYNGHSTANCPYRDTTRASVKIREKWIAKLAREVSNLTHEETMALDAQGYEPVVHMKRPASVANLSEALYNVSPKPRRFDIEYAKRCDEAEESKS